MGRPKGSKNKKKPPETVYKCMRCGMEYNGGAGNFYKTKSKLYEYNEGYYPVCQSCLKEKFEEYKRRYSERIAVMIICHYLDVPFYYSLYDSIIKNNDGFNIGMYMRQMNNSQYRNKTFVNTLIDKKELGLTAEMFEDIKETKWTIAQKKDRQTTLETVGYDPFEGYNEEQRKFLFSDIIGYLSEDGIEDDRYKISQIIQLVSNNYQILQFDMAIAKMDPKVDINDIKVMNDLKKKLVDSNDKIAKENGISVKNRIDKQAGRSTLTYLMRRMRELDIPKAEANYYDQLRSEGTQWAANMSMKALKENGFFDENDFKDIVESQYRQIQELQKDLDDKTEECRLLLIENDELKAGENG